MSLSSVKSETALRSRLFSSSRSFRRFTCSVFRPPNSCATDNTSPHSPRSGGLHPPCSGPARPEHRPAAASRRSLQACIASLPLQSSWMSKTYLKSDHFNGGGSILCPISKIVRRYKYHRQRDAHPVVHSNAESYVFVPGRNADTCEEPLFAANCSALLNAAEDLRFR